MLGRDLLPLHARYFRRVVLFCPGWLKFYSWDLKTLNLATAWFQTTRGRSNSIMITCLLQWTASNVFSKCNPGLSNFFISATAITSVSFSHRRAGPLVNWISVNKDVLFKSHWLLMFQSRSSHKCRNDGFESLPKGKRVESEMTKTLMDTYQWKYQTPNLT